MHLISKLFFTPVLVLFLFACSSEPARVALSTPPDTLPNTWEPLLREAGVIELKTLTTGGVSPSAKKMLNLQRPGVSSLRESSGYNGELLDLSVFAHWLQHPRYGDYLIDSGFDDSFTRRSRGNITGLLANVFMSNTTQNVGQDIGSQVKQLNLHLKGIFFTHLHGDHTAGVPGLPPLDQYVVGKGEAYYDIPMIYSHGHLDGVDTLLEIDFDNAKTMPILGKTVDIWGDHSLLAIDTRGHSKGHVSYLLNTTDGWVLLTGDASHTRWGFEHGVEPGLADDRELTRKSFEKLAAFAEQYPQVKVIFGHEH